MRFCLDVGMACNGSAVRIANDDVFAFDELALSLLSDQLLKTGIVLRKFLC
jgi:hypothetical protein